MSVLATMAQSLSGKVALKDTIDCPIATVRINDLGIGTTAKMDGTYLLTDIAPGKHLVEFSYVGYKTVTEELTFAAGEKKQLNVTMEPSPITLGTVFITPDGSDASSFILNKVWDNAARKYKAAGNFKFNTSMVLSYQDLDMFKSVLDCLPPFLRRLMFMMVRMAGFKGVMDLMFAYPQLDVQTTNGGTCTNGRYKWGKEEVKRCNVALTNKEKQALNKLRMVDDLYKEVYVNNLLRKKKTGVRLTGSYEENGKIVYIVEGVNGKQKAVMHVIEDSWDVVKYIEQEGMEKDVWELRRSLGGLYMPVSYNTTVRIMKMSPDELKEMLEETEAKNEKKDGAKDKKPGRTEKRIEKGMEEFISKVEKRGGLDCRFNVGVAITYSK